MEIKVLKMDTLDILDEAWEISRPGECSEDVLKILAIDAPINDIPCSVLHIKSSIAEREVFASARDHVMWAKTSRVSDPTEWGIPLESHSLELFAEKKLRIKP